MQIAERRSGDGRRLSIRQVEGAVEFAQAHELYRSVFGYSESSLGVNPRLLATLLENGGTAVGVFVVGDGSRLVGFSFGYPGLGADGENYHYSQVAVVSPEMQGRGIGRMLKLAQAESARLRGARHMRWSFDPVLARNAHFNLNVLGARGRWFTPNFYGANGDRMTVEWDLNKDHSDSSETGASRMMPAQSSWGIPIKAGGAMFLPIPAQFNDLDELTAGPVRDRIRSALFDLIEAGEIVVGCDRVDRVTAIYRFAREL